MEMSRPPRDSTALPHLQWSHGDVAMEIDSEANLTAYVVLPSMEPWRCSHGDAKQAKLQESAPPALQWAMAV